MIVSLAQLTEDGKTFFLGCYVVRLSARLGIIQLNVPAIPYHSYEQSSLSSFVMISHV